MRYNLKPVHNELTLCAQYIFQAVSARCSPPTLQRKFR